MSNVITYKKVTDVLADIAARHYLINTFFVGEINDLNAEDLIFPVFQMYPSTTRFPQNGDGEYKTIEMTLKCRILDKQKQNGDDEIEIHNDTFATAQDVINEINQHPFYSRSNVTLLGDVNLNPLNEYMDDFTAGWEFDINLQLINNNSFCGLPMADITGYSASGPVSTGYSISFQYLQCDENLSACTYLDWFIDSKINAATGVTSQNYYTTGATLVGTTAFFNRNDLLSAYTLDLSSLSVTGAFLALSGGTVTGNTYFTQTLTASTFNAGVIQSGGTNLYSIFLTANDGNDITRVQPGSNISTGGTENLPVVNLVASPSINGLTFSGTATGNALSANTISGGTLYSGNTNLYNIFATTNSGDITRVQPGTNVYTGGTANFPTVNVSGGTFNNINVTGGTLSSGGTDLYSIFLTTNDGNDITRVQPGTNTYTGGTSNFPSVNISALTISSLIVSGNSQLNTVTAVSITGGTVSGGTFYSGSTPLYSVINNMISGATSGITGGNGSAVKNGLNTYTGGSFSLTSVNVSGGTFDNITVTGNTILSGTSASTLTILNSGTTNVNLGDWSSNVIKTGVTRSNIIGGTGNTINNDLRNVQILGGVDITGKTSDTVYVNILTGSTVMANTLSGTTTFANNYYSGNTNLTSIFLSSATTVGEINTASSVGSGNSIFKQKSGVDLQFRSLSAGTNIIISTGDTITINTNSIQFSAGTNVTITTGSTVTINSTGGGATNTSLPFNIGVAASDETTSLTTGNAKITFLTPRTGTLSKIVAGLTTSGSSTTTVRINKNSTVVSTNNIDITANNFSASITTPTLTATTMTAWDTYTVDITTAGTGAKGLKVYFEGSYTNPFTATTSTIPWELGLAMSDETSILSAGTANVTMLMPFSGTVTGATYSLSTSGSTITSADTKINGVTIFSTKPTIDANEFSTQTAATPPVITATTISQYDTLTFAINGAGTGAKGLKVWLTGTRNI